ncbi:MAG: hypothetical protein KBA64_13065 [Armatimonadetes bacterium]|jgi:carbonic anhydrase|nr:hypothetical protein [Armatimonadota bacterium]
MVRVSTWQRERREEASRTLAIFCSDGRYARYLDEFFESNLRLEGAHWVAVPGGAAPLAGRAVGAGDGDCLWREVDFLVQTYKIDRFVLVFHEDCGHYKRLLGAETSEEERTSTQCADAVAVIREIARRYPDSTTHAYRQHGTDTAIYFEQIDPDSC